jgi:diacylglycerol O-acyltransferase / wax synthase
VKRLNGMDALLLYSETPNLHTHTLKVAVVDAARYPGEFSYELFRRTFGERLPLLDPLRYELVDIPWRLHHPMWLEDCDVDLDYHLRRVDVPAPGGRRELDEVIGKVASTPLDRRRPLWEFYFAEGMADQKFALIGKIHHALADGVASANLLASAMDPEGPAQVVPTNVGNCGRLGETTHSKSQRCQGCSKTQLRDFGECSSAHGNASRNQTWPTPCRRRRRSSTMWCRRREDLRRRHSPSPR